MPSTPGAGRRRSPRPAVVHAKTNLAQLLRGGPDGIFVAPFEQGEIGPDLFRAACNMGLEGMVSKRADRPIAPAAARIGSRYYGAGRTARGCGTLGALSNVTNGAPHVATF